MSNAYEGTITRLKNGRFWARTKKIEGKQKGLGTFATWEEAEAKLHAFAMLHAKRDEIISTHITFGKFGPAVLEQRELDGTIRGVSKERDRWKGHLANCSLTNMALQDVEPMHIVELVRACQQKLANDKRGRRKISSRTVARIKSFVSVVFDVALQRGLVKMNPCLGIKVTKRKDEDLEDEWTFLTPDEQHRVLTCEKIPFADRVIIAFALYTGIRQGEQHSNLLPDLHVDGTNPHLYVRRGSADATPKSKKKRIVPLIPQALDAANVWLEIRRTYMHKVDGARHEVRKDIGLIFPTVTGCRRRSGKTLGNGWKDKQTGEWVDKLKYYFALAGIADRPGLHWHCLRHTCATSLLEGWWDPKGRGAALEEVKEMLGHSSIAVTERYAHHAGTRLRAMAERMRTSSYAGVTGAAEGDPGIAAISNDSEGVGRAGHDPATYGLKEGGLSQHNPRVELVHSTQNGGSVTTSLARAVLELVQAGRTEEAIALANRPVAKGGHR